MDGFHEKKWFVYLGDHHEGPFSLGDIQQKLGQGTVTRANYVWCDGMADWAPMPQVAAFAGILETANDPPTAKISAPAQSYEEPSFGQPMEVSPVAPMEIVASVEPVSAVEVSPAHVEIAEVAEPATMIQAMEIAEPAKPVTQEKPAENHEERAPRPVSKTSALTPLTRKLLVLLVLVAGLGAAYSQGLLDPVFQSAGIQLATRSLNDRMRPYLLQLIDRFPQLGAFISPLPNLDDVASSDADLLKAAALAPAATPSIAVVPSQSDPLAPELYVAANVPDGTVLQLTVIGIPDTLLNHLSFETKTLVMIMQRMGKSAPLHYQGTAVPRGEYVIFMTAAEPEPPASREALNRFPQPALDRVRVELPAELKMGRVVAIRSLFLGGKRDASYAARLKEYHDKLAAKASAELLELKQFSETLDAQLKSTTVKFDSLRRRRLKKDLRRQWNDFHVKWTQLTSSIIETFQKIPAQTLDQDYFYGNLYRMTQAAGEAVLRVHEFHQAFFTGNRDPKTFDIQLGAAVAGANNSLSALKAKVEQAGKIPPSPNGMPRKDGL